MVPVNRPEPAQPLAEACADRLRAEIVAGGFQPGQRLDEVALGQRLAVSRNTLREAFRLLGRDQLVEHVPNRGVFVCTVDARRAREVYEVRRHLELGSLETLQAALRDRGQGPDPAALDGLRRAVEAGEQAREVDDWIAVGTANSAYHQELVALGGNQLAQRLMTILAGLTRLRFLTLGDARAVHEKFLDENRRIYELVAAGELGRARAALELYLLRAEADLAHG